MTTPTKGIVIYYLDRETFEKMSDDEILKLMTQTNKSLIEEFRSEGYPVLFVTTTKEATRVEKVDFSEPFPAIEDDSEVIHYETAPTHGLVTCYLNRDDGFSAGGEEELMKCMTGVNEEAAKACNEAGWPVLFIPTVDEGSRVQKVDFEYPFPLYPPKKDPTATVKEKMESNDNA